MALIKCPECNKEISDKANFCPHCGYSPINRTKTTSIKQNDTQPDKTANFNSHRKIIGIMLLIIGFICLIIGTSNITDKKYKFYKEHYKTCVEGYEKNLVSANFSDGIFKSEYTTIALNYKEMAEIDLKEIWKYRSTAIVFYGLSIFFFILGFKKIKKRQLNNSVPANNLEPKRENIISSTANYTSYTYPNKAYYNNSKQEKTNTTEEYRHPITSYKENSEHPQNKIAKKPKISRRKKKIILLSTIILTCVAILIPTLIHLVQVDKYRMTDSELSQYQQCIIDYEKVMDEIDQLNSSYWEKYEEYDYNYKYHFFSKYTYDYILKRYNLYMKLLNIKFPDKYLKLYTQLVYTSAVYDISDDLAFATIDVILDEIKDYSPPNDLLNYREKIQNQLYNEYYIPKDYSSPNFEQILFKIKSEYIDGDTSASKMYDELHEIFYNEEFLKQLK